MPSLDDEDEFGLSSGDEAELLQIDENVNTLKRKASDGLDGLATKKTCNLPASPAAVATANKVLRERFGIPQFRLKQESAITRLLDGGSSVVVFPTGGGKSLCYQVPALCFKELDRISGIRQGYAESGLTLIVSPLLALMKDQTDSLKRKGINAASLDSSKSREEYLKTVDDMRNGTLDILYCAPERLNNEGFVASMANVKGGVRLLAVDEAHCISEWGHAFRPDYLKVARFAKEIEAERVVCLTATATPQVAKDICQAFNVPEQGLFRTSTYRSNLKLQAESFSTKKEAYVKLLTFLKGHPGPTVIYVTTHKQSEDLATQLSKSRLNAKHFHAGMKTEEKLQVQDAFLTSKNMIICATIAFGMGIDKPDIRNVLHYDLPQSLEGYSQEIGRAGRDGLESHCMMFLCAEDLHLRESFARGDLPSKPSINGLLRKVFALKPTTDPQPVIEATLAEQSKEFDIKLTVLGNIYAQFELRFNLLRATTPRYTNYQYKRLGAIENDRSPAGLAIRNASKTAKIWTTVDMERAAHNSGVERTNLVAKLNEWHDRRLVEMKTGGVVNIFRVMTRNWPPPAAERQRIVDELYTDLELREQQALDRMEQVMDLVTSEACFANTLANHFGDKLPYGKSECGHCTWCRNHVAVPKVAPIRRDWNATAFMRVLGACQDRDDPRHLARIAFGIRSPRIAASKLGNHAVFGSMEDHDFMELLSAFEKVCEK